MLTDDTGTTFHMFDAYALVNTLLCTCVKPNSTTSAATTTMRGHCPRHFDETLRLLSPNLVIVQGANLSAQNPLRSAVTTVQHLGPNLLAAQLPAGPGLVCT